MQPNISKIKVDQFTVPYTTAGEGPAVVCCELPLNSFSRFAPLQKKMSDRYQITVIDLRPVVGYSAKEPPAEDLLEFLTEFFLKILDALTISRCAVIGSFMFGAVSMNIARIARERIQSLVLLGSLGIAGLPATPLMRFITGFYRLPGIPLFLRIPPFRILTEWSDHYVLGPIRMREMFQDPQKVDATLEDLYEHYKKPGNDFAGVALMWAIRKMSYQKLVPKLHEVLSPALIIHGENDKWISAQSAEELRSRLANATLVIVPETRHAPELENVELTCSAIETFFETNGLVVK
jgi:pimeloyl-ACP methyl ester carboxylesterase